MSFRVKMETRERDGNPSDICAAENVTNGSRKLKVGEVVPKIQDGRLTFLVGSGSGDSASADTLRKIGAAVSKHFEDGGQVFVDLSYFDQLLPSDVLAQGFTEGALLGSYRFDRYRSKASLPQPHEVGDMTLIILSSVTEQSEIQKGLDRGALTSEATALARDLINEPPSDMTPKQFASIASQIASSFGLEIRIWGEEESRAERLGGLLGVARGSVEPPQMIRLHYTPKRGSKGAKVALVGKGITFDSGGLSLKSGNGMMTMKTDMSGAAAVLASMSVLGRLDVQREVFGYMALTENLPSGSAQKPGDVLTTRNGKTIEVLNTDAEGRLVLADALSLALEDGNEEIVDIATLTGACVVALGDEIAGIMGTGDELIETITKAGDRAGEAYWKLPVPTRYKKHIDSEIADMRNIGASGKAGTMAAALLLREFVGEAKWAHLDIAGPARADSSDGYISVGATGFGTRTFLEWLLSDS